MNHTSCDSILTFVTKSRSSTGAQMIGAVICRRDADVACMEKGCLAAFCGFHVPADDLCPRDRKPLYPVRHGDRRAPPAIARVRHLLHNQCDEPACEHRARYQCTGCFAFRCGLHCRTGRRALEAQCPSCEHPMKAIA